MNFPPVPSDGAVDGAVDATANGALSLAPDSATDLRLWSRITLSIIAAPTLSLLQDAALRGALELSGASAGIITLLRDESESGEVSSALSIPPGISAGDAWKTWDLESDGVLLGQLRLLWTGASRPDLVDALCAQIAAVTAKTRMFEQLQHIKREWQAMLDGMIDGVYVCDERGTILRANRALAAMLGLAIPAVLGHKRDELWETLTDYTVLRPWQSLDIGPSHLSPRITEFRCGRPDRVFVEMAFELRAAGSSIEVDLPRETSVSTKNEDKTKAKAEAKSEGGRRLCVLHDVTESRRLQEQLLQSEKLAALGELTSGVAHELNNPLATVVGYAELLDLDKNLPDGVRRKVNTIHQEATRASHIVQNLLAYARRSSPEKAFVSVNDVLGAAVEMRRYQLHADNVRISTDYADNVPLIWGDDLQLQQVFLNIINNAVQAVQSWRGSGEIRLSTQTSTISGASAARVIIEDNGPGIAPEHLRRVFDPFFTTKPAGEGTGLGMSIALRVVSNHEGLIWAESRLGHGARFIIELPGAVGIEEISAQTERAPLLPAAEIGSGRRVLVVDDEEPVVTLISEILSLDGHQATPAFNGAEAIALLSAGDYDLILSDVRMPAVGGPTFFEILQTTRPDLLPKVIFVTGDTMSQSTQDFLQRAGRPVLPKPFDPERLRTMVADNLRATS
ncbi:PAS domain-containing protein [Abditibacterium utsteinense]|uniref:histidine kinase n=1 Tax=Abditibacterium utsteinense TaxID=1960156 RepID=A0A2S8SXF2_9BACT|nr:ATP-binding protein [Abditibacterium utsteinense]PQV65466.1 PAS domain-containing protein [Abditibacterium utsteinense]